MHASSSIYRITKVTPHPHAFFLSRSISCLPFPWNSGTRGSCAQINVLNERTCRNKLKQTRAMAQQQRWRRNAEAGSATLLLVKGKEKGLGDQIAAHAAVGSNRAPEWEVAPRGSNRISARGLISISIASHPISRVPIHTPLPTEDVE